MRPPRRSYESQRRIRALEIVVFIAVSSIGVYALGTGLLGLVVPGRGFDLIWLAVAAVAVWILFAQMGRVQDAWPRRDTTETRPGQPIGPREPGGKVQSAPTSEREKRA